ncbi:MAG: sigma-54-dependent Fis family transcriptional regulator [Candidatus Krumholzibacteriota bacterium]|nr:sigma-54-dependent Fis family transcriptional regulator [Candidatus Krumholzibacteriota bacterium]
MNTAPLRVAIVDDNAEFRGVMVKAMRKQGFAVEEYDAGEPFVEGFAPGRLDLILVDLVMPGIDGIEVIRRVKKNDPTVVAIVVSAHGSAETIVEAIKEGAFDFLTKPFRLDELRVLLEKALRQVERNRELASIRGDLSRDRFCGMIGRSAAMRRVFELTDRIARRDVTVLVTGASGTGKELLARAIHNLSPRRTGPFMAVNCGAIPDTLIDAELFGHEKGSFTGANASREGIIRAADGGTLFLDEIGDLPLPTQLRLLRFLQEKEIRPVGSDTTHTVDVRVVSATNRDLEDMVRRERFRDDLFYRLSVVPVQVPTLAARRDDIPLLVTYFVEKAGKKYRIAPPRIEGAAMDQLIVYDWPGNVRELENVMERLVILATGGIIRARDLPRQIASHEATLAGIDLPAGLTLDELERRYIERTIEEAGGNRTRAAEILGIDRRTIQRKLRAWDDDEA